MDIGPSNRKSCRAQLVIGPGTTESLLDIEPGTTESLLDIEPGTTESLLELNSTVDLVQRKALSSSTRH